MPKVDYLFSNVPKNKRTRLLLDDCAYYSVTPSEIADQISLWTRSHIGILRNGAVVDGMACVGGNAYSFSRHFHRVLAIEFDQTRCGFLEHNMRVLQADNVICANQSILDVDKLRGKLHDDMRCRDVSILFLDPEWGGPGYKKHEKLDLYIANTELSVAIRPLTALFRYILIKVPTNFDTTEFLRRSADVLGLKDTFRHRLMHVLFMEVLPQQPTAAHRSYSGLWS